MLFLSRIGFKGNQSTISIMEVAEIAISASTMEDFLFLRQPEISIEVLELMKDHGHHRLKS
jgi:predicted transcriptional regulator